MAARSDFPALLPHSVGASALSSSRRHAPYDCGRSNCAARPDSSFSAPRASPSPPPPPTPDLVHRRYTSPLALAPRTALPRAYITDQINRTITHTSFRIRIARPDYASLTTTNPHHPSLHLPQSTTSVAPLSLCSTPLPTTSHDDCFRPRRGCFRVDPVALIPDHEHVRLAYLFVHSRHYHDCAHPLNDTKMPVYVHASYRWRR